MKNKILIVISTVFLLLTIISITACNSSSVSASNYNDNYKNMFTRVYTDTEFYVVYDNETKVMYTVSDGLYNHGSLTMLVNADGTPKLYDGE